jgi:glycosyltransferase 2 family protein
MAEWLSSFRALLARHPRALAIGQVVVLVIFFGFVGYAIRDTLHDAGDLLRDADPVDFAIGCAFVGAYYLAFVVGWIRILNAWHERISYPGALRAEMVSMLAKYVPGGVWTPAARVVAARRAGIMNAGLVTASILLEAGLSAISGVILFVVSLNWVEGVDAPVVWLVGFALVLAVLLHPRVFQPLASKVLLRFGCGELPPMPTTTLLALLVYYVFTWLIGGAALFFLIRAVGGDPTWTQIPYFGGVAAVGAIVAVLVIIAPSGLGVREGSMSVLLYSVTSHSVAVAAVVLNRVAITIVEIVLLLVGGLLFRAHDRHEEHSAELAAEKT